MNLLFGRTISLQFRLTVAVILSILLILGDRYTSGGTVLRTSLHTLVSPLLYFANVPYEVLSLGARSLQTRDQLLDENQALREKQLLQSEQLQQLQFLQKENQDINLQKKLHHLCCVGSSFGHSGTGCDLLFCLQGTTW